MRLLLIVAAYAALTVSAFAETPREIRVPIDGVIQLQVGETRFFDFSGLTIRVGRLLRNGDVSVAR